MCVYIYMTKERGERKKDKREREREMRTEEDKKERWEREMDRKPIMLLTDRLG